MQIPVRIIDGDLHFFEVYAISLHLAVLIVLVSIAAAIDIRERRIPNRLVLTGVVIGTFFHSTSPHGMGTFSALLGLGTGIALFLPIYLIRAMGAGDVKLMGMVGTFLGVSGVVGAVLATMAAGGVLALGMTASKRRLPQLVANLYDMLIRHQIKQMGGALACSTIASPSVGKMPYAIAICAGTLIHLFFLS